MEIDIPNFWCDWLKQFYQNFKEIPIKMVSEKTDKIAVIIEPRKHPLLKYVVFNFMKLLAPYGWGLHIFCGSDSENFCLNILDQLGLKYQPNIALSTLNLDNLTEFEYNSFLKSIEFYNHIINDPEYIIIFQTDTILLNGDMSFFINKGYDFVGAPWKHSPENGCNGGLSLRNIKTVKRFLNNINNINNINYTSFLYENEDGFFSFTNSKQFYIPSFNIKKLFSSETIWSQNPKGLHASWKYQDNKILKKFLYRKLNTFKKIQLNREYKTCNICIACHIGTYKIWDNIKSYIHILQNQKYDFDLWFTVNISENRKRLKTEILKYFPKSKILFIPNRGLDIGGFFYLLKELFIKNYNYDYILKIHTKNDKYWRDMCTIPILDLEKIYSLFKKDTNTGLICTKEYFVKDENIDKNIYHLSDIFAKFKYKEQPDIYFQKGAIFWCRFNILKELYKENILWIINRLNDKYSYDINWMRLNDEKNIGNILWKKANLKFYIRDGMFEHSLERFLSFSIKYLGYHINTI